MTACHVCPTCGGRGVVFDRRIRMDRPCHRCGGSGSGLSRCEWHHLYGWATSHRPEIREYLRGLG